VAAVLDEDVRDASEELIRRALKGFGVRAEGAR
jgi:hypothetical protein